MAPKGEETRERILRLTAPLFNKHGFSGSSLSDVMKATGLQKGGLYNHFSSKEELAVEAFDYAVECVQTRVKSWLEGKNSAPSRLRGIIDGFVEYYDNPPISGGCPIMNTAIENDDSNPRLRERAREHMRGFLGGIEAIIKGGIKRGELKADVNAAESAIYLMTLFEGALMMSKLHNNPTYLRQAAKHMRRYVEDMEG